MMHEVRRLNRRPDFKLQTYAALRSDSHAFHGEDFDHVPDLQVVVLIEADTALKTRLDLADIVLETAERADLAGVDDDVVAEQACLRITGARDAALGHHAAGDGAELRHLERFAHIGDADADFLER